MKSVRLLAVSVALVGAATQTEANPDAVGEMSAGEVDKILAFFGKLLDTMVAHKDDCLKMAGAIDALVDANKATLRELKGFEASGKRLPAEAEQKLTERMTRDSAAVTKCLADGGVQAAMKRLRDPDLPPAPSPTVHAEIKAPVFDDLAKYTKDLAGKGDLIATIKTSAGAIKCQLLPDQAPLTVANFVGLATGKKPWLDPRTNKVVKNKPFYDGTVFHRVIPDFMIQGGDRLGTGYGGPGYTFGDETATGLKMVPGVLAMANSGPATNGSQFFITESAPSNLDGKHTIFGQCAPLTAVGKIARVPRDASDKPDKAVTMKITIRRGTL